MSIDRRNFMAAVSAIPFVNGLGIAQVENLSKEQIEGKKVAQKFYDYICKEYGPYRFSGSNDFEYTLYPKYIELVSSFKGFGPIPPEEPGEIILHNYRYSESCDLNRNTLCNTIHLEFKSLINKFNQQIESKKDQLLGSMIAAGYINDLQHSTSKDVLPTLKDYFYFKNGDVFIMNNHYKIHKRKFVTFNNQNEVCKHTDLFFDKHLNEQWCPTPIESARHYHKMERLLYDEDSIRKALLNNV